MFRSLFSAALLILTSCATESPAPPMIDFSPRIVFDHGQLCEAIPPEREPEIMQELQKTGGFLIESNHWIRVERRVVKGEMLYCVVDESSAPILLEWYNEVADPLSGDMTCPYQSL